MNTLINDNQGYPEQPNKIEEIVKTEVSHRSARLIWALYTLEIYLRGNALLSGTVSKALSSLKVTKL